jgi:hypothetical protein
MDNATHLGLDVHKDTIAVAVLRPGQHEPDERTIPNTPEALRSLVGRGRAKGRLVACYEAGPTGYDTYRLLTSLGVPCDVIAPTLIPRRAGRRVKTDRIDARNLARLHRARELTAIRVPTPEEEAIRDLVRVREDLKDDRRRTMHRMKSFLLRQGRRYPAKTKGPTSTTSGSTPSTSQSPPRRPRSATTWVPSTPVGSSSAPSTPRSRTQAPVRRSSRRWPGCGASEGSTPCLR